MFKKKKVVDATQLSTKKPDKVAVEDITIRYLLKQRIKNFKFKDLFKNKDATSIFIMVFSLVMVVALVWYIIDLTTNQKEYEGYSLYEDPNLNFSMDIPSRWTVGVPDEKGLEDLVLESTQGFSFDTRFIALKQELTPLTLIQQDITGKRPFKKLIIMSMFGQEHSLAYVEEYKAIEKEFKVILTELGHKDIKILETEPLYEGSLMGTLTTAEATFDGHKMYYAHYVESLDKNVMRILYGSKDRIKDLNDLNDLLSSLTFKNAAELEMLFSDEELEQLENGELKYEDYDATSQFDEGVKTDTDAEAETKEESSDTK